MKASFFLSLPNKTMVLKAEVCKGGKVSKKRAYKQEWWVWNSNLVAKTKKPRWFKGINLNIDKYVEWQAKKERG